METQKQYVKLKPQFKKFAALKVASSAFIFFTILLLVFLPCFRIQPEGAELGEIFGVDFGKNFSLYDEFVLVFSPLFSSGGIEGGPFDEIGPMIYQGLPALFFVGGLITAAAGFIKSIMHCIDLENYIVLEYDNIKSKVTEQFAPKTFFLLAVIGEIFAIVTLKILSGTEIAPTDYIASMNAVAWGFWIVAIFLIADIMLAALSTITRNKLRAEILKED